MAVDFKKYHGLGNDYLVIDPDIQDFELAPKFVRLICDRHFGIGADGILWGPFKDGEILKLRIFNPDGSEAEKSGNGLRIFSKYLFEKGYVSDKRFNIETADGMVDVEIKDEFANVIKIGMGKATFISNEIPVEGRRREVIDEKLKIGNGEYKVTCLSIGNPHCVIPMEDISEEKAKELGPIVENHNMFPNRINMQLLKVLDRKTIEIRVWERGAGYTLASGSSSCAAAIAAYKLGLAGRELTVKMPGGDLSIDISKDEKIFMTGPVESVFEGTFCKDFWDRF